jgi:hypothetical protein
MNQRIKYLIVLLLIIRGRLEHLQSCCSSSIRLASCSVIMSTTNYRERRSNATTSVRISVEDAEY